MRSCTPLVLIHGDGVARVCGALLWAALFSCVTPAQGAPRQCAALEHVRLQGELGERFTKATANVLDHADRYNAETFRSSAEGTRGALWWDWPGDQVGRWLSVVSVAQGYRWPDSARARALALDNSLPYLNSQGCFGPVRPPDQNDARIPSGNAFALRGLMDAYEDTRDPRCLEAAQRLREYYADTFPTWHAARHGTLHEFWGHCLDGLVKLYQLGHDQAALKLARQIAATAGRTPHTHHSLSLYRGVLALYDTTGDPSYLAATRDYLAWCKENRLVDGGVPESMPRSEQDEGCALADYVVLNLMLFASTGEDPCVDEAENTLVNHFCMNQFHTGGFGHRGYGAEVVGGKLWQGWQGKFGSENPGCCSLWGAWALGETGRYVITKAPAGYEINLYAQASVAYPGVRFDMSGDFPRMTHCRIALALLRPQRFALRLRVPAWAQGMQLSLNGQPIAAERDGARLLVERRWKSGDALEVTFKSGLRLLRAPHMPPRKVALFDGPLCLALCSADADVSRDWSLALNANGDPVRDAQGRFQLRDGDMAEWLPLSPISEDWKNPDVFDPHRLRIVFGTI